MQKIRPSKQSKSSHLWHWCAIVAMTTLVPLGCSATQSSNPAAEESKPSAAGASEASEELLSKLSTRIEKVLDDNLRYRILSADVNAAWQIMHGVLAYGKDLPLEVDGARVNAVDYLLGLDPSGPAVVDGWQLIPGDMIPKTERRGMKARLEPGSYIGQGHVDQWIAIFSQIDLPLDYPVKIGANQFTIEDWVRQAQFDVPINPVLEYSWTLIALARYIPDEPTWRGRDGQLWAMESFADFEAKQDLASAACGGMHRLTGLAHAVQFAKRNRIPIAGGWKAADDRVQDSIDRIRRFQNSDGTFSINHTERPGASPDLSIAISSTGHTLEFLASALEPEQLKEPWVTRAVERLCAMLEVALESDLDCGGLYHSLNGLKLYHQRLFKT